MKIIILFLGLGQRSILTILLPQTTVYVKHNVRKIQYVTDIPMTILIIRVLSVLVIVITIVGVSATFIVRKPKLALYGVNQLPRSQLIPHRNQFFLLESKRQ